MSVDLTRMHFWNWGQQQGTVSFFSSETVVSGHQLPLRFVDLYKYSEALTLYFYTLQCSDKVRGIFIGTGTRGA